MERVPENARDLEQFILDEVLRGIELNPQESQSLISYMGERHEHLFGPFTTYFVLGSYERPFKFRLESVLDELNHRFLSYAYLLATQPDPDLSERLPTLKIKFYLHAIYADWIPVILEHNTGGALAEFGRADRPFLFDRTYVFPRGHSPQHVDATDSIDEIHARCVELAYEVDDEGNLINELEELADEAAIGGLAVTVDDLTEYLRGELGGRLIPSYSGVITDGIKHYEIVGRCFPWTTEEELRSIIDVIPGFRWNKARGVSR